MSRLSPDTLFHFTPSLDNLLSILKNTFYPRYCYDEFDLIDNDEQSFREDATPMVCFCDIPLSQLMNHIETYGKYGLGMSKEWGEREGLNPVIYYNKNSYLSKQLSKLTNTHIWGNNLATNAFGEVMLYIKPYEGTLYQGGHAVKENTRFYDEHEWRYIPDKNIIKAKNIGLTFLQQHMYLNTEVLAKANSKLETDELKLSFHANDIKYIIINNDSQINNMVKELRDIKGSRYDRETVDRLMSRIITVKQIQNDF
ncbi:abortive infection system antitoxin AbiGi family protein [Chloroflexota bacterium]